MSDFEFVFALYSILLGFSLVELLSGIGRAVEYHVVTPSEADKPRIGWLTPMLAVFVLLDLLSFWGAAWAVRNVISVSGFTLMGIVLFASCYYLAARLVFPTLHDWTDLDRHYFQVKNIVLGLLLILLGAQLAFYWSEPQIYPLLMRPVALAMTVILVMLMGAAMLTRNKTVSTVLLTLLILRYIVVYLW